MRLLGRLLIEEAGGVMPGIDGVEAAARITAARPETVVVAWTSNDDPEVRRRFALAGAAEGLLKTDLEGLRAALRRHLA